MLADVQPLDGARAVDGAGPEARSVGRVERGVAPIGWRAAMGGSAATVRDRPALVAVGLLGFLARGGLVMFLLPIVALPTPIGISTFIGGTALTGAGASDGLIRLIAFGVALVAVAVLAGTALGAVADVLMGREAVAFVRSREDAGDPSTTGDAPAAGADAGPDADARAARVAVPLSRSLVARVLAIRIVMLIPVALAVAWGTARLVSAGYQQLILPDDLTVPLAVRILVDALDAAVVVVVVWLAAELLGGLAVRHVIVGGRSVGGAFAAGIAGLVRRPLTTLATYGLGVVGLAITAGPTLLLAAILWSRLQALLADNVVALLLPATFLFVLVWGGGLAVVGFVVAWRGLLGGVDVLRALPVRERTAATATAGSGPTPRGGMHASVLPAPGSAREGP